MSLIGKVYTILMKRVGGAATFVSLETADFTHEAGATTSTSVVKFDTVGTANDTYEVKIAYPNGSIPAGTTTITNLITTAANAVDAVFGALEGRVVPAAPTIGTVTLTSATAATVAFTAPSDTGGTAITGYTVTSVPAGITATGAASPIAVSDLDSAVSYKFKVKATNGVGSGPDSALSAAVLGSTYSAG
jgi:hypothetical protein